MNPRHGNPQVWRLVATAVALGALAGCADMARRDTAPAPAKPASAPEPVKAETDDAGAASPAAMPAPAAPQLPALPPAAIPKALTSAIEALEAGQEDVAEPLLRQILQTEPSHRQANSLLRQIKEDPQALYGREFFTYRIPSGESLSKVAQRFLNNDAMQFYGLARYNGIKVPRLVGGGQSIKVPGKQPAVVAPPPAPPVTQTAPAPKPPPQQQQQQPKVAEPPAAPEPDAAATAEAERRANVARLSKAARAAVTKQDLKGGIQLWDKVLELDPGNRAAVSERQRALDLLDKLNKVKKTP